MLQIAGNKKPALGGFIRGGVMNIKKLCIPSKESETHQLTQGTVPGHYDPDTQTIHGSLEQLKQLEAVESSLAYLPEPYLIRAQTVAPIV
jgi:hypothetical protein